MVRHLRIAAKICMGLLGCIGLIYALLWAAMEPLNDAPPDPNTQMHHNGYAHE